MIVGRIRAALGRWLAAYISRPTGRYRRFSTHAPAVLRQYLAPGDVLLVEGDLRVSSAIKYLTQSTWSHAALYVGDALASAPGDPDPPSLIEADLEAGVIAVPLSKYADFNTRICRPVGLTPDEREQVVRFMLGNLGKSYDLKHVFDLARYLLATPPVPSRYRRRMLALGSGDPTRAICSTLIAQAFQGIRYPVLPSTERIKAGGTGYDPQEVLRIRHHSLFVPRDFDLSPYFRVVKPTIEAGFNHRELVWAEQDLPSDGAIGESTPVAGS